MIRRVTDSTHPWLLRWRVVKLNSPAYLTCWPTVTFYETPCVVHIYIQLRWNEQKRCSVERKHLAAHLLSTMSDICGGRSGKIFTELKLLRICWRWGNDFITSNLHALTQRAWTRLSGVSLRPSSSSSPTGGRWCESYRASKLLFAKLNDISVPY